MGIVNVTPDSFSDGGRFESAASAIEQGKRLMDQGADLLDIGGESTRPGSQPVPPARQWQRIRELVEHLAGEGIPISVDTRSAEVAKLALDAGAYMINDVSAGRDDPDMLPLVAERGAPIVLMHMQGDPSGMQVDPHYEDCTSEVLQFLSERAAIAESSGVDREQIWIDPGIGFGKTVGHNLELLENLDRFAVTGYHVLLGTSRKSFIDRLFEAPASERLGGSLASLVPAARAGIHAVRVHDVRPTYQFLELLARVGA